MKPPRDWLQTSPHGTARERFARIGRLLGVRAATGSAGFRPPAGAVHGDELRDFFRNVAAGAQAHDLGDESLYLAEELAELQWSLGGRQKRALALLVLATMISVRQGSSRLPLSLSAGSYLGQLVGQILRAGKLDLDTRTLLRDIDKLTRQVTLDHIIGRVGEYRPLIVDDGCVYQHRMLWCEDQLAARLRGRLAGRPSGDWTAGAGHAGAPGPGDLDAALTRVLAHPAVFGDVAIALSAEQQYAVRRAISQRLTVISGGPGTGKTAIVVTMLRVLAGMGEPVDAVALAAPTGKAANRMWSSIRRGLEAVPDKDDADRAVLAGGAEPQTLHRLLGYLPAADRFRHHENNPLAATTVIVDEASMIDLVLMERLLRALRDDARLVLLGDADQLPSVDAGAVLRDLVIAGSAATPSFAVRLTHSYRMDASDPAGLAILTAARAVNAGDADVLFGAARAAAAPDSETETETETGSDSDSDSEAETDSETETGSDSETESETEAEAEAETESETEADSETETILASEADSWPGQEAGPVGRAVARATPAELAYHGVEILATGGELGPVHAFVDAWHGKRIRGHDDFSRLAGKTYQLVAGAWSDIDRADLAELFATYERSRLLTVTRRQATGSEAINRRLHRRVLAAASVEHEPEFYPGEPVMMRRNDYERGLFNGDQGMVVRVSENRGPQHYRVVFPRGDGFAVFPLDALRSHIELAFAMTVHKSQGSEFDEIALILPTVELPLLTREMLYTGVTRARRSVVLVGTEELARVAVAEAGQRFSGLADKLAPGPDDAIGPADAGGSVIPFASQAR